MHGSRIKELSVIYVITQPFYCCIIYTTHNLDQFISSKQKKEMKFLNVCNSININIYFSFSLWFQISSISNFRLRSVAPENIAVRSVLYFLIPSYSVKKESSIYKILFSLREKSKSNNNLNFQFLALKFYFAFFSVHLKEMPFYFKHLKHLIAKYILNIYQQF